MEVTRTKISPGQLAKEWGVDVHKVHGWIKSGELPAINAAQSLQSIRPRYLIDRRDIEAFERVRATAQGRAARTRSTRTVGGRRRFPRLV